MSTIRDVAKLANVSIATVSRVINNDTRYKITEKTRQTVIDAITELDYKVPKKKSRSSSDKEKATCTIGCILSVTSKKYLDPYFMSILSGVEKALKNKGYELSFIKTGPELNDNFTLEQTFKERLNGLIIMESLPTQTFTLIKKEVDHIVGIDTVFTEFDNVGYDHFHTAFTATEYLIQKGYKEIGFIGGSGHENRFKESRRYLGYHFALSAYSLDINEDFLIDCKWNETICSEKVSNLCSQNHLPQAFFVASDLMAMAALNTLYSSNVSVPQKVAIMGLSNIEVSKYSNPPLSTISIPTEEIGMVAADLLTARINGYAANPLTVTLPVKLIERSST